MESKSDYLFARPSVLEGVARIMDFAGALNTYNVSPPGEDADRRALAADWAAIGNDLRWAIAEFEQELEQLRAERGKPAPSVETAGERR